MKLFYEMSEEEIAAVDLVEFTGLKVGDKVLHVNAGDHGGNGTRISTQTGIITGHQNHGLYHFGGLCVTVTIKWEDGSDSRMVHHLAKKVAV